MKLQLLNPSGETLEVRHWWQNIYSGGIKSKSLAAKYQPRNINSETLLAEKQQRGFNSRDSPAEIHQQRFNSEETPAARFASRETPAEKHRRRNIGGETPATEADVAADTTTKMSSSPATNTAQRPNKNRENVGSRAWSSVILAVVIFLNSLVYFVCQTIASNCLAQVIAKFPFQIESFIPFRLRVTTVESAEQQSQAFTQSTVTNVEATTGG